MQKIKMFYLGFFLFVFVSQNLCHSATYYVKSNGVDAASGLSIQSAWKTTHKVSIMTFSGGDTIKFEGGTIFDQTNFTGARLWVHDSGSVGNPIVYTSYDTSGNDKKAIIKGGIDSVGIFCAKSYIEFRNLIVTSPYNPYSQVSSDTLDNNVGIYILKGPNSTLTGVKIFNCKITRFLNSAILVSHYGNSKCENILIENCDIDSIVHEGINIQGSNPALRVYPFKNITIRNCKVTRVTGLTNFYSQGVRSPFTGGGILLLGVDSSLVERCVVNNCGGLGYVMNGGGPDAFEAANSANLIFQHNEAYDQKSSTPTDAAGFHLGNGVKNSFLQYNYAHDNDGAGFSLHTNNDPSYLVPDSNNVIRYNVSAKNARACGDQHGDIQAGANGNQTTYNVYIYNNTIYALKNCGPDMSGIFLFRNITNVTISNNIIVSTDSSVSLIRIYANGISNLSILGNSYWSTKNYFEFEENGSVDSSYAAWQSHRGRELKGGVNVGFTEDPQLINPGNGGNVNDPYKLDTLTAYKTRPNSIIRDNGFTLDSLNPGSIDFYGTEIPYRNRFDIGAYEDTSSGFIVDLSVLIEGRYNSTTDLQVGDTVTLHLVCSKDLEFIDSSKVYINSSGKGSLIFESFKAEDHGCGDVYFVLANRNSIQTWSKLPVYLSSKSTSREKYDFTNDSSKAYGNNMVRKGSRYCIYSGDVNQDGNIDFTDVFLIFDDVSNFVTGYVKTDLDGNLVVDQTDVGYANSNANNFIEVSKP